MNTNLIKSEPLHKKPQELYKLEEIFIGRIMDLICKKGINAMTYFDYMTFKIIVEERKNGLNNLKDCPVLEKLINVKKNIEKNLQDDTTNQGFQMASREIKINDRSSVHT